MSLASDGFRQTGSLVPKSVMEAYWRIEPHFIGDVEREWTDNVRAGTQAPNFFDVEDLTRTPPLADFVSGLDAGVIGPSYRDTHRLTAARIRLVAPSPLGYLNWHVDHSDGAGTFIKLLIYLADVPMGEGEFCYVRGSHLGRSPQDDETVARAMGHARIPGRAGTGIIFDTAGIHAPAANRGARTRQTLLLSFARW